MSVRSRRVAEEIKKEIAQIIRDGIKDPRVRGLLTVTNVEVSDDIRYAKIFVSYFGEDEGKDEAIKVLTKASGFIRSELAGRLRLRYTPELTFKFDESIAYGAKISELIRKTVEPNKGDS